MRIDVVLKADANNEKMAALLPLITLVMMVAVVVSSGSIETQKSTETYGWLEQGKELPLSVFVRLLAVTTFDQV